MILLFFTIILKASADDQNAQPPSYIELTLDAICPQLRGYNTLSDSNQIQMNERGQFVAFTPFSNNFIPINGHTTFSNVNEHSEESNQHGSTWFLNNKVIQITIIALLVIVMILLLIDIFVLFFSK